MALERCEVRIVASIHVAEANVHVSEARVHPALQTREPAIHPLFELSNRHAKAANHSIVVMRR
jgi:hypothetical protein